MSSTLGEASKGGVNDKVLANCSTSLAFLSAYTSDANQMLSLFDAFEEENDCIDLPMKFGILTNGNETIDKSKLVDQFKSSLLERLEDTAGFKEVDDDCMPQGDEEDEMFHFKGALDILGHVLNTFCRRDWCQTPQSPYLRLLFGTINESKTLSKLHECESICSDSYKLLTSFFAQVPVRATNGVLVDELKALM